MRNQASTHSSEKGAQNGLKYLSLGIDTQQEMVAFLHESSPAVISEGFDALTRLRVIAGEQSIVANLNVVRSDILAPDQIGLSMAAARKLQLKEGDWVTVGHLLPIPSLSLVRKKVYGHRLTDDEYLEILQDITAGHYSNIYLSAFISACSGDSMDLEEVIGLTKAMVATGDKISWNMPVIADKHCVGGLPGNRTTPIVVAIIAAAGLMIPKTSSRAITSPSGTADTMETLTRVDLSLQDIKRVVSEEHGCLAWGGAVKLSPADDMLIRVEKALDLDSEGQLIASVLSKKAAAGSTHVLIDIPVGPTAKVRTAEEAERLESRMKLVGNAIGLQIETIITDGRQPVGRGIGPAAEALDVLSVLRNDDPRLADLKDRALTLAGRLLELCGHSEKGMGFDVARSLLESGAAIDKFRKICISQGGIREPKLGPFSKVIPSTQKGLVSRIDNRRLALIAKLAGAPQDKGAGLIMHVKLDQSVDIGDPLFCIYADSEGELRYAIEFLNSQKDIIQIL